MRQPQPTFEVDGAEIRHRRMQMGLEMTELAERVGISRRYLSHLENGTRTRMRPRRYAALCKQLDARTEDLLAPQGTQPLKE
ncbi:helix-turn-helix domain-containing protein [Streptomyces sp. CACIS-1.16CA]|uniref:helix-turn-helix domain-containing protein n=1 Tax=Streptomyces sp. CACIS-1.16CA TaxID=1175510 RepID=UPI0037CDB113